MTITDSLRHSKLHLAALSLLGFACACGAPRRAAPPNQTPAHVVRIAPLPAVSEAPAGPPPAPIDLYAAEEALDDALTGEWTYLGTTRWPGISRARACVFRNERVFVVNVYCTIAEEHAFRVDVYSPSRGRVRFYAEANGRLSAYMRKEYFTFQVESEPPPGPETGLPALTLDMSLEELRAYDAVRYDAFLPLCFGGEINHEPKGGCLGTLSPQAHAWAERNRPFLADVSADWYWLIRKLRPLSVRYGVDIE